MNKEQIIDMVDSALDDAYRELLDHNTDFGPVNWADLECVELVGTHDGWIAYVEEAAPDCKLPAFVQQELARQGAENVTVITRW